MHYASVRVSDLDQESPMVTFLLVAVPSGHVGCATVLNLLQASILLDVQSNPVFETSPEHTLTLTVRWE